MQIDGFKKESYDKVNKKKWKKIIIKSPDSTIFHTPEFVGIQREVFNIDVNILISEKCVFPIFRDKIGIFPIYGSPLPETGSFYGGPVCVSEVDYSKIFKNMKFGIVEDFFSIFFLKTPCNVQMNLPKNYEYESVRNYILEISRDIDDIWKKLNKKTRNAIRKAEKSGVRVEIGYIEDLPYYMPMIKDVIKRSPHTPIPYEMMRKAIERDIGKLFIAYYKNKPVSGGIFLTFKDTVTYWSGASLSDFRRYQPSNLLHWEVIKWAVDEGYKYYDLGGAEIPSIAKFKKGWGGREVYYYRVYKKNFLTKLSQIVYRVLRKRKSPISSRSP